MTNKIMTLADLVKYEHTIFALPFAYIGSFLAAGGLPDPWVFLWVTMAMVGGRTAAMAVNRLADRYIDARNPRTAARHLPSGQIEASKVFWLAFISFVLLGLAAWKLNPLCVAFLPAIVLVLVAYSYTKRFTWACHLVLGLAYFFVPFGGWIAVTGEIHPAAAVLGLAAGLWVAGFDIIYATQDYDFDTKYGIHSIPARFGIATALRISSWMHIVTVLLLLMVSPWLGLGWSYLAGVIAVAALLYYEHSLVSASDLSRLDTAFFTVNGYIALIFFFFSAVEVLT